MKSLYRTGNHLNCQGMGGGGGGGQHQPSGPSGCGTLTEDLVSQYTKDEKGGCADINGTTLRNSKTLSKKKMCFV